jgi:hypothetical protein
MSEIILKGTRKYKYGKESFEISRFNAGVVMKTNGAIIVTISCLALSENLNKFINGDRK